jgi:hypothetical protein
MATSESIYTSASIEVTLRDSSREASNAFYDAVLAALHVAFKDVVSEAKGLCPVGREEKGEPHTRDTITADVFGTKKGPFAKLYTESGHGGFVEVGTIHMTGHPYLWPAFQMNLPKIVAEVRAQVQSAQVAELGRVLSENR